MSVRLRGVGKSEIALVYFWHGAGVGNFKSRELHCLSCEPELLWIQGDPVSSTDVEPLLGLVEAFLYGRGPQERVVNALRLSLDQCHNLIIPPGIAVPRSYVALGCCLIAVTTPWCYEGCEMFVCRVEGDGMVSIPCIKDGLAGVGGNGASLMEG